MSAGDPLPYSEVRPWAALSDTGRAVGREFVMASRRRRFARREVLFHEGDPADTLHLVVRGRVAVRSSAPSGDVVTLAIRGPGEMVGELAVLGPVEHRSGTVAALEPTETLSISRSDFETLRARHPEVNEILMRVLAQRVREGSAALVEALYLPADARVLRRLLDLAGVYDDGADHPTVPVTQDDLATLAGTTRGTVNRVLRREAERGSVEVARGRIRVLDTDSLRRRARG